MLPACPPASCPDLADQDAKTHIWRDLYADRLPRLQELLGELEGEKDCSGPLPELRRVRVRTVDGEGASDAEDWWLVGPASWTRYEVARFDLEVAEVDLVNAEARCARAAEAAAREGPGRELVQRALMDAAARLAYQERLVQKGQRAFRRARDQWWVDDWRSPTFLQEEFCPAHPDDAGVPLGTPGDVPY